MQLTYDLKNNIAYIRLREKTAEVETIHISEELNIDLAADGSVHGIEFLNANAQLTQTDEGKAPEDAESARDGPALRSEESRWAAQ